MVRVLTAHQPLYMPWLGFFQKVSMSDTFCLWDDVQFTNDSFIHRNNVKTPNGPTMLTVPIHMDDFKSKTIKDMTIDRNQAWRAKHWNTILTAYESSAPYFECYRDFFEDVYKRDWEKIIDLDEHLLKYLFKELKINVDYVKASDLGFEGKRNDRILDMCIKMDSDLLIFGQSGETYADLTKYREAGKLLHFQKYKHPKYPQLHGAFAPNMSVIDLLFCFGEKSRDILERGNPTRRELINKYLSSN
ncbi:WbqC family protein [Methanocella sp. MCL-LM]|uniref:WbqC family protein n=1 Tax=Methanocella sp. MCL-LM TaxID=3412035 RepID=UPI003C78EC88